MMYNFTPIFQLVRHLLRAGFNLNWHFQNGLLEITHLLRNGSMMLHVITSHTTGYIGRLNSSSVRPMTRPTGATGIGALRTQTASLSSLGRMLSLEELSRITESWEIHRIPTTAPSTRTGQSSAFQLILVQSLQASALCTLSVLLKRKQSSLTVLLVWCHWPHCGQATSPARLML